MVSLSVLSIVISIIAIVLAFGAVVIVVDVRAKVSHEPIRRNGLEGQTKEVCPRAPSGDSSRVEKFTFPSEQPVSSRFRPVPQTPPTAIAPGLQNPPRVKGGFGSQAIDKSSEDDKASQEGQAKDSSSSKSGTG